jgi:hypothetical protein
MCWVILVLSAWTLLRLHVWKTNGIAARPKNGTFIGRPQYTHKSITTDLKLRGPKDYKMVCDCIVWAAQDSYPYKPVVYRRGWFGGVQPPPPEIPKFWQSWAEFPIPWKIHPWQPNKNTGFTHLQIERNPWLRRYGPRIPVLSALCPQLNMLKTPPPPEQNS